MENTAKSSVLDRLSGEKRVYINYRVFDGKHCKRISRIYIYIYIYLTWPPALEHGKIEENTANSGIFKGLGRQGNWKHFRT